MEEFAKRGGGEEVGLGTVGYDAAFVHHEDAVDFGEDVGDVVGDEEDSGSLLGQRTEEIAEVALGGEIETDRPVTSLADFYAKLWKLGPAGVTAPIRVKREREIIDLDVRTIDRASRLKKRRFN